jgi:hypothetical protein
MERNIPVLRIGTLAAMPSLVSTKIGHIEAYLIEARSLGGLSGSPVFLNMGPLRYPKAGGILQSTIYYLVGVVHGHFNARKADPDLNVDDQIQEERINAGIAIVTPVSKLLEIVNKPSMLDEDRQMLTAWQRQTLPEMD